jgi:hypothetical protein
MKQDDLSDSSHRSAKSQAIDVSPSFINSSESESVRQRFVRSPIESHGHDLTLSAFGTCIGLLAPYKIANSLCQRLNSRPEFLVLGTFMSKSSRLLTVRSQLKIVPGCTSIRNLAPRWAPLHCRRLRHEIEGLSTIDSDQAANDPKPSAGEKFASARPGQNPFSIIQ